MKPILTTDRVKIKKYLIIILLFFFTHQNLEAIENKILFKIDSEIITSIEIFKYSQYFVALNENIRNLNDKEIFEVTKNLLVKEKIKKIKLKEESIELNLDEKVLDNYIQSIFSNNGINNLSDYKKFLKNLELDFETMEEKLIINLLWNNLIFEKFSSKLKINKNILKEQIKNKNNNYLETYLLSEIFFEASDKLTMDKKNKEIRLYVDKENFKKAALVFSISDSANDGGNIGWINANALNKNISKALSSLNKGDITNPIPVPGGFLILRLDDKKFTKKDINLEEELNKLIKIKTNQQLSQFSSIYFNKVKKGILVNEF